VKNCIFILLLLVIVEIGSAKYVDLKFKICFARKKFAQSNEKVPHKAKNSI